MTVVARDLSDACGLTIYADRIWTGGGCIGLGVLAELKFIISPKLEMLCSSSFRPHLEEPSHMSKLPPAKPFGAGEIFRLTN